MSEDELGKLDKDLSERQGVEGTLVEKMFQDREGLKV